VTSSKTFHGDPIGRGRGRAAGTADFARVDTEGHDALAVEHEADERPQVFSVLWSTHHCLARQQHA
jgi:hypothetical protein